METVLDERKSKYLHQEAEDVTLEQGLENIDLYSDTTSQYSGASSTAGKSAKTNPLSIQTKASSSRTKSSKNRRKHERKKYSTKEGGAHEDIGLIASLHELINEVYYITVPEVAKLIRSLVRIPGQFQRAKSIQEISIGFLNEISDKESIIWTACRKENLEPNGVRWTNIQLV